jgi:hypothetical protein
MTTPRNYYTGKKIIAVWVAYELAHKMQTAEKQRDAVCADCE